MNASMLERTFIARMTWAAVTALAAGLLLTSCAPGSPPGNTPAASEPPTPAASATALAPEENEDFEGNLDARAAAELALETVPGAVIDIELERDRTEIAWEVGLLSNDESGVELSIDAHSREVLRQSTLRLESEQRTAPGVTAVEAIDIAQDAVPGRVVAADLDREGGRVVWEVEILGARGGTEVYVDAATGEVVKQEIR